MMLEELKNMVEEIIGDNGAMKMLLRQNGIQLEWNSKDWAKVEDVIFSIKETIKGTGYMININTRHAIILPASKVERMATDQNGRNTKRW